MNHFEPFLPVRILCPVDFSGLSDLALKYAAAGARVFDATLVVFHAHRFEPPAYFTKTQVAELIRQHRAEQSQARDFLRRHVRKRLGAAADQLRLQFETADAHPVDAILKAAGKHRTDLIVLGTQGRGGAQRLWLGSVAENVIRRAEVPVFVVRQKQHEFISTSDPKAAPRLATILCPVNFSQASRAALRHAVSLAQQFNAQLITPCVIESGDSRGMTEAKRELAAWLVEAGAGQCDTQIVARKGQAAEQIVSLAAVARADLVVLGAHRRSSLQTWLWGDTTELVLRHAPAPVLVVPH